MTALRDAGFRGPVKFQPAPLFKLEDAPFKRAELGGYKVEDPVWFSAIGKPGVWRKGRVINILHKAHLLILRVENPDRIVDLNPLVHGVFLRHRQEDKT